LGRVRAVDGVVAAGHERGSVRCQERHDGRDLFRVSDPADRVERRHGLDDLVGQERRPDEARTHGVHLGFFACVEDLEDELIRAIGPDTVLDVIQTRGELEPFRILSKQPEWRERPVEEGLRRFLGNSYRKTEYAPLLVAALDLSEVPRPLDGVLSHV
jgi:hypothetical protein